MAISPQQLKFYLTSAHRAVIFAIAQLSCIMRGPHNIQENIDMTVEEEEEEVAVVVVVVVDIY